MRLRLLDSLIVEGHEKQAGEIIEAPEQEAKILILIKRAELATDEEASPKPKSRRGRYNRRDMRAEQNQYETKQ